MRKALLFIGLVVLASAVSAAPLVKVAFMGIEPVGVGESAASGISESLLNELINTNRFTMVERDRINTLLEEQGLSISGCTTTECYVQVGQLTGAEKVLVGTLSQLERLYILNVRIVDVYTGTIELSESEKASSLDALLSQTRNVAQSLAAKIPVTGTVISVGADTIKIDMGLQEGVTVGTDLVVFRYGEEYYHPETGLLLGRDVDELGHVKITKVLANELSEARLVGPFSPQVGDKVRLSEYVPVRVTTPVVTTPEVKPTVEATPAGSEIPMPWFGSFGIALSNAAFTDSFLYTSDLEISSFGGAAGFGFITPFGGGFCMMNLIRFFYLADTVKFVDLDNLEQDFSELFLSDLIELQIFLDDEPLEESFSFGVGIGPSLDIWMFSDEDGNTYTYDTWIGMECSLVALMGDIGYFRFYVHMNFSSSYTSDVEQVTYEHLTPLSPGVLGFETGMFF